MDHLCSDRGIRLEAQSGIAVFGQFGLAAERAGLDGGEARSAELQELPVMSETAQITSFGQDGQSVDRADPRD